MKRLFFCVAAAAAFFAGCSEDEPQALYAVLDFESATILAGPTAMGENLSSGFEGTKYTSYTDKATGLTVGLNVDEGADWSTEQPEFYAGGIAPSRWTDMETPGYENMCSVYGTGGAGGSKTFGVGYYSSFSGKATAMSFEAGAQRLVHSAWVANTTYTALYRDTDNKPVADMKLVAEGFDAAGKSTGKKDIQLAGKTTWELFDLAALGKVNRIEFSIVCEDPMAPAYFCIDNVKVML